MPLLKCGECHHEWESVRDDDLCDWCGAPSYVLEKETPLKKMLNDKFWISETIQKIKNKFKK